MVNNHGVKSHAGCKNQPMVVYYDDDDDDAYDSQPTESQQFIVDWLFCLIHCYLAANQSSARNKLEEKTLFTMLLVHLGNC